jgi:hypothetical protein
VEPGVIWEEPEGSGRTYDVIFSVKNSYNIKSACRPFLLVSYLTFLSWRWRWYVTPKRQSLSELQGRNLQVSPKNPDTWIAGAYLDTKIYSVNHTSVVGWTNRVSTCWDMQMSALLPVKPHANSKNAGMSKSDREIKQEYTTAICYRSALYSNYSIYNNNAICMISLRIISCVTSGKAA